MQNIFLLRQLPQTQKILTWLQYKKNFRNLVSTCWSFNKSWSLTNRLQKLFVLDFYASRVGLIQIDKQFLVRRHMMSTSIVDKPSFSSITCWRKCCHKEPIFLFRLILRELCLLYRNNLLLPAKFFTMTRKITMLASVSRSKPEKLLLQCELGTNSF